MVDPQAGPTLAHKTYYFEKKAWEQNASMRACTGQLWIKIHSLRHLEDSFCFLRVHTRYGTV